MALPLPTLLSQILVAFTIEFDNEFEHQMPHRTTISGAAAGGSGPWLVSLVMWSNFMQFVGERGVTIAELQKLARTPKLPLDGMERWGYVVLEPGKPRSNGVIRATAKGRRAQEVWRSLFEIIEKRWAARFGEEEVHQLRTTLGALIGQFDFELPAYLPVLGYGLSAEVTLEKRQALASSRLNLAALLSKGLLAFAIDFERESELSLAICANVLRVLDDRGVRVRDLPRLAGVSKEAIKTALGFLASRRHVVMESDPSAVRIKLVRLTPKGKTAQQAYRKRLADLEEQWQSRFSKPVIRDLRESLQHFVAAHSIFFLGLSTYPDGWRASVPPPETLPHYPMVLHRGGYPDGS